MAKGTLTATKPSRKKLAIGRTSRPVQSAQPASCYGYCCVFNPINGFAPKSLAELPPQEDLKLIDFKYDYAETDHFQMSRNVAMATVAEMNAEALRDEENYKEGYPGWWHFVIKIVPAGREWNCLFNLDGDHGTIDGVQLDFEIVKPTADELEVYSIEAAKGA